MTVQMTDWNRATMEQLCRSLAWSLHLIRLLEENQQDISGFESIRWTDEEVDQLEAMGDQAQIKLAIYLGMRNG